MSTLFLHLGQSRVHLLYNFAHCPSVYIHSCGGRQKILFGYILALVVDHAGAEHSLELSSGWERYGDVLAVINHLGLDPDADFTSLSGGTKRRVALARALICSEDLILDEPTNHLDIATITWLEDFLLRKARTLIFVSHDRAFAKRLATRVVEIDRGKLHNYSCGFDRYPERREERLAAEERAFALQDKKLAQEEVWIRQGIKARRTRNMSKSCP